MNREKTAKNLPVIAAMLGAGWVYNQVLSSDHRGFLLTRADGLVIDLHTSYNEVLPQWSISYKHPKHGHYISVVTIGCSLEKSLAAVAADIKTRLLNDSNVKIALEKLTKVKAELNKNKMLVQNRGHVINALSLTMNIEKLPHHSDFRYRILDEQNNNVASLNHTVGCVDSFSLSASGLTVEQLIKIEKIINNK